MYKCHPPYPMAMASTTATAMPANWPCDRTASAPCSMVSLILSCFSSLREICSGTHALLNGFEHAIVTQDANSRLIPATGSPHVDLLFRQQSGGRSSQPFERC